MITDVLVQHVGPVCKGQAVQEECQKHVFECVGDGVSDDWFSGKVRESVALTRYLVVKNETVVHYENYMQDLQLPHWLC